ncbi:hypothetical protein [Aequorivita lipolytica]|uniref:Uncharacterized protein n=1 Tax=Aequorivita lipolytica TaxID=153267 RepID=A0A5C6YND1_9FLAO|nr:hypothetical protein [Aequorivita lipolytica]TXD69112.1 hypothetical protein ESV24_08690 [Aequorivita lipolytica]SRX51315.1 hypothetical protein AEQU2_01795 [Aequorivita lipolytica]
MTKKDFFRIIIKLFGLYSLILAVFYYIPSNISYIIYDFEPFSFLWILGILVFVFLVYIFLILKTDKIIDLLKIDKGFDDDRIVFSNFNSRTIVQLALIVIGGFLIIDYLPDFLHSCYLAFKKQVATNGLNAMEDLAFGKPFDYFNWAIAGMNIILGYILLTNYVHIAKWLNRKDKNDEPHIE